MQQTDKPFPSNQQLKISIREVLNSKFKIKKLHN